MKKYLIILISLFLYNLQLYSKNLNITTSIEPMKYLIKNIGGKYVNVNSMLTSSDNPHIFQPSTKQLTLLSKSDIYMKLGSGVEFELNWMHKFKNLNKNMDIINLSKNIKLIPMNNIKHKHESMDPHIWVSIKNAIIISKNIEKALIKFSPKNKNFLKKNLKKLLKSLNLLYKNTKVICSKTKNKTFLVYHPAFGYFANDFNLKQIPIESEGKEPGPKYLFNIINKAKKNNIKIIFTSPFFNKKGSQIIAKEIKGKVISINFLSGNYLKILKKISNSFIK